MRRAGDNKIEQSSCTHISLVQKKRSVQIFNSVFRVPCMKNLVTAEQYKPMYLSNFMRLSQAMANISAAETKKRT